MDTKTCSKCKETKPVSEFYRVYGKPRGDCKRCNDNLNMRAKDHNVRSGRCHDCTEPQAPSSSCLCIRHLEQRRLTSQRYYARRRAEKVQAKANA